MATDILMLLSHGEYGYACADSSFIVPPNITISFYYNPLLTDTAICISKEQIPHACDKEPLHRRRPGERCTDLVLSRADDIKYPTGLYNCRTRNWETIPGLEGKYGSTSPSPDNLRDPRVANKRVCLSKVAKELSSRIVEDGPPGVGPAEIDLRILACAVPTKFKMDPTRVTMLNPVTGESISQSQYNTRRQASRDEYKATAERMAKEYYDTLFPVYGDEYSQREASRWLEEAMAQMAGKRRTRRKRTKTMRRKNKTRSKK